MENAFFKSPILNSPYEYPARHWELDDKGQPTQRILDSRRDTRYISPIPRPRKQKSKPDQKGLTFGEGAGFSSDGQAYDPTPIIKEIRYQVDAWRKLPSPFDWHVTPETARLLQHWRHHSFAGVRPFFCQIEAAEIAIWLTEVAPDLGQRTKRILTHLADSNAEANPGLNRLALKLATGAGKTTVMAMLIAWQTLNAARRPGSSRFTRGFLIVSPGLTIRDRLRVLLPNDPNSYYKERELIPADMMEDLQRAKIVITNYHAFKLRERLEVAKGTRSLLQGRTGEPLETLETEGQMMQRVMPDLMGLKNIMVLNDEAHHCYRRKVDSEEDTDLKGDDRKEAEQNNEAARLWISGLEAVNRQIGIKRVMDLSATPFFLRGSGYPEGTLFHWTMSDFSLMDAIECGIVKLPRVPVADNIPGADVPIFRNLWENIRSKMPKKGRGKAGELDPREIPLTLQTALTALHGHYKKVFEVWERQQIPVPPCFIIVCQNTAVSKLIYEYVSGFTRETEEGILWENGRLEMFRNYDENGTKIPRPRTLLIDSEQLESGDALEDNFHKMAASEIEQFRQEIIQRTGSVEQANNIKDQDLLREVMNTVGKQGRLGDSIRCVVSVSMLTEGWDANNVTHILGVRAFGTQLLCEQVMGRALRRQSYELNSEGLFNVEYADILGIPFDFTANPVVVEPQVPPRTTQAKAMRPERDHLEIRFPRVQGYRVDPPKEELKADFTTDSTLILTPGLVGPSDTLISGIVGESTNLNLEDLKDKRTSTVLLYLTQQILYTKWRDPDEEAKLYLFGELKRITRQWMETHLKCQGGTYPALLLYQKLADTACERITGAITRAHSKERPVKAVIDPYNPVGSTIHVKFNTSKTDRYQTDPRRCHINWVILDSDWEAEFCRVAENHPRVLSYVKNQNLGFEVPYLCGPESRRYLPDFIVLVDDGHGLENPLHLVVEVKGYRNEDAKQKKDTIETFWIPGVNNDGRFGRWAFAEFTDVYEMQIDFKQKVEAEFNKMIDAIPLPTHASA